MEKIDYNLYSLAITNVIIYKILHERGTFLFLIFIDTQVLILHVTFRKCLKFNESYSIN
jgi:hypothetical protein